MAKPITAAELARITAIEKKQGPVGKGHHNSHRTAALLKWMRNHDMKKAAPAVGSTDGDGKDPETKADVKSEATKEKFVPFTKGK